ncbi:MAG: hypothetical protein IPJ86_13360 [Bacteroidetes bacterium]|nr:hypothetical protein [Bacteroidota bacterium]
MHSFPYVRTLVVQGSLLIINGLATYAIIGGKATKMMLAAVLLGMALWVVAWFCNKNPKAIWVGLGLSFSGLLVFTQRTIANFLSLIGIVQHEMNLDAYNKSIMVVFYILMSCSCLCGLMLLYTYLPEKKFKNVNNDKN